MATGFAECKQLVVATGNPHKRAEFKRLLQPLSIEVVGFPEHVDVRPVEENQETLQGNSRKKATEYARQLGEWVIADDTGLEVDTLNGRPGVLSSRFAGPNASSEENIAKLLEHLSATGAEVHPSRFVCHVTIADPLGEIHASARGACRGRIIMNRKGTGGFGYDSHFEISEYHKTLAEFGPIATDILGHRGRATRRLIRTIRHATRSDDQ